MKNQSWSNQVENLLVQIYADSAQSVDTEELEGFEEPDQWDAWRNTLTPKEAVEQYLRNREAEGVLEFAPLEDMLKDLAEADPDLTSEEFQNR